MFFRRNHKNDCNCKDLWNDDSVQITVKIDNKKKFLKISEGFFEKFSSGSPEVREVFVTEMVIGKVKTQGIINCPYCGCDLLVFILSELPYDCDWNGWRKNGRKRNRKTS